MLAAVVLRHQDVHVGTHELGVRVAEDPFRRRVDRADRPRFVHGDDRVQGRVHDRGRPGLAPGELSRALVHPGLELRVLRHDRPPGVTREERHAHEQEREDPQHGHIHRLDAVPSRFLGGRDVTGQLVGLGDHHGEELVELLVGPGADLARPFPMEPSRTRLTRETLDLRSQEPEVRHDHGLRGRSDHVAGGGRTAVQGRIHELGCLREAGEDVIAHLHRRISAECLYEVEVRRPDPVRHPIGHGGELGLGARDAGGGELAVRHQAHRGHRDQQDQRGQDIPSASPFPFVCRVMGFHTVRIGRLGDDLR